jgi:prepilin peptidase dependent protein B
MSLNKSYAPRGFTVIELLVGLAVGLVVIGGVLSVYVSTLKSSGATLNGSRLNQEMGAIMSIMVNDVRRAGYARTDGVDWDDPLNADPDDLSNFEEPYTNPFSLAATALQVQSNGGGGYAGVGVQGSGNCIVYSYDLNSNAVVDDTDKFGFRWDGAATDALMMRSDTVGVVNNCGGTGWDAVTDPDSIVITALSFDLGNSKCLRTDEPDDLDSNGDGNIDELVERDCYIDVSPVDGVADNAPVAGSGVFTVETREVLITLTAQLKSDATVSKTMSERVTVRNNLIRVY